MPANPLTSFVLDPTLSLTFVGGGNMASALIAGLCESGCPPHRIAVVEPDASKRDALHGRFGVAGYQRLQDVDPSEVLAWAVKPQSLASATASTPEWARRSLHLSIAAGVPLLTLREWLGTERVVRAMPNTSAVVRAGVTGLHGLPSLASGDRAIAEWVFGCSGHVFWTKSDDEMDAVTAVGGSGPAYLFEFLQAMQAGAVACGLEVAVARELVLQVAAGAARQALADPCELAVLRARVTSPGGTTAAALDVLQRRKFQSTVVEAISAARHRARELRNS